MNDLAIEASGNDGAGTNYFVENAVNAVVREERSDSVKEATDNTGAVTNSASENAVNAAVRKEKRSKIKNTKKTLSVQDYMKYLAGCNLSSMTVHMKDGHRIDAKFIGEFANNTPNAESSDGTDCWSIKFHSAHVELSITGPGANDSPIKQESTFDAPAVSAGKDRGLGVLFNAVTASKSTKRRKSVRKPRKVIPEVKDYVEYTEKDILFGRGGKSNRHAGNKFYRDIVIQRQAHYRTCDKNTKTKVAQEIVDRIQNEIGGRFLELDKVCGRWYIVHPRVARGKVGQALRENNTEEARAVKRAKYRGKADEKADNSKIISGEIAPIDNETSMHVSV